MNARKSIALTPGPSHIEHSGITHEIHESNVWFSCSTGIAGSGLPRRRAHTTVRADTLSCQVDRLKKHVPRSGVSLAGGLEARRTTEPVPAVRALASRPITAASGYDQRELIQGNKSGASLLTRTPPVPVSAALWCHPPSPSPRLEKCPTNRRRKSVPLSSMS